MIPESKNDITVDGVFIACICTTCNNYTGGSCRASTFTSSGKYEVDWMFRYMYNNPHSSN